MTVRADQKQESRARILASAGRGFRERGYGALGVDGLAKEAGVTSGAFYAHFKSKAAAFQAAVVAGMQELRAGLETMRDTGGPAWRRTLIDFYLTDRRTVALAESCALQSLTNEVARGDPELRQAYERELRPVIDVLAETAGRDHAIALLALLSGGVSLARAVDDPALAEEIATAVRGTALRIEAEAPPRSLLDEPPPEPGGSSRPDRPRRRRSTSPGYADQKRR